MIVSGQGKGQQMNHYRHIDERVDAIYSDYDGGWYLQDYSTAATRVSDETWDTWEEARDAYLKGIVEWED